MSLKNGNHDLILVCGVIPCIDNQVLLEELENNLKQGVKIVLLSPIEDTKLANNLSLYCKYEAGSEEGVIALLTKCLASNLPEDLQEYFDDLDDGYLSAETNIGEDEIEEISAFYEQAKNPLFIFGRDFLVHERSHNIEKLLHILKNYSRLELLPLTDFTFNESYEIPEIVEELKSFDGTAIVVCKAKNDKETKLLIGSPQFSIAAKSSNNQDLHVNIGGGVILEKKFVIDENLKGTIALMPMLEEENSYRYKVAKITKREVQ